MRKVNTGIRDPVETRAALVALLKDCDRAQRPSFSMYPITSRPCPVVLFVEKQHKGLRWQNSLD
jgi:hypothetical protein